jgi:hypothetical protein
MHSGKPVKGVAHPAYRTGRHSKHMPKEVRKISQEALADEGLLSLREQLALLEARQAELARRLEQSPPVPWPRLVRAAEAVEKAALSPDPASRAGLAEAVTALRGLVSRGRQRNGPSGPPGRICGPYSWRKHGSSW